MKNKINKYDIGLILIIIVINVMILVFGSMNTADKGKKIAYVYSNNQLVGEYTLTEDYKTEFKVESGSGYNVIHIEGGKVWVQDASCPDKVCLHQGKISSDGEFIACLPNGLMITIVDNEKNENDSDIMTK
jgi:hypothetical protein